jgi:hypothetical protein
MSSETKLVYQLKITLDGIRPPIWRRILVSGETTLDQLHDIIQIAMGWEDDHLIFLLMMTMMTYHFQYMTL